MIKSSFQVIMCDQYSDISSISNSDQESDNVKMSSELDYFDEDVYDSDDGPVVTVNDFEDDAVAKGEVKDEFGNGDDADEFGNCDEADEFGNGDDADEFGNGDEVDEFGNDDDADEFGNGDEADELSEGDEVDEFGNSDSENDIIIVIDSDDEYAIVQSNMHQRIQTFVYTIRRDTTYMYIGGRKIDVKTYAERGYYERWN